MNLLQIVVVVVLVIVLIPFFIPRRPSNPISAGLNALVRLQSEDGSWPFEMKYGTMRRTKTVFPLFSTCAVLLSVGNHLPPTTVNRAIDFLIDARQRSGHWIYDPSPHLDLPHDADDTACCISCIARFRPAALHPNDIDLLRQYWIEPHGPFRTWDPSRLQHPFQKHPHDPVVNANVLMAFRDLNSQPPVGAIDAAIQLAANRPISVFYPSGVTTTMHAFQRAGLPWKVSTTTIDPHSLDALQLAQWLYATQTHSDEHQKRLIDMQQSDGLWPYCDWCGEFGPLKYGSAAVTTAFAVEALISTRPYYQTHSLHGPSVPIAPSPAPTSAAWA